MICKLYEVADTVQKAVHTSKNKAESKHFICGLVFSHGHKIVSSLMYTGRTYANTPSSST